MQYTDALESLLKPTLVNLNTLLKPLDSVSVSLCQTHFILFSKNMMDSQRVKTEVCGLENNLSES